MRSSSVTPKRRQTSFPGLTLVNLALRFGGSGRGSSDVGCDVAPWKAVLIGCRLENLASVFKVAAPATGIDLVAVHCQLVHVDTFVDGATTRASMIDCRDCVESGTTWTAPEALEVRGCAFLGGTSHIRVVDGVSATLLGNSHSLAGEAAVRLEGDLAHWSIVGSRFLTSGADLVDAAGKRSHVYVADGVQEGLISGCSFSWPHYDAALPTSPLHLLELDETVGSLIRWVGNEAARGCVDVPFLSTGSNSSVLRVDEFVLDACVGSAGGTVGDPNGATDIFSATMTNLYACLVDVGTPFPFGLVENRKNIADCDARRVILFGKGAVRTIDLSPAPLTVDRVANITFGTWTGYELGGQTIAGAAPSGLQAEGRWLAAKRIYSFTPAPRRRRTSGGSTCPARRCPRPGEPSDERDQVSRDAQQRRGRR